MNSSAVMLSASILYSLLLCSGARAEDAAAWNFETTWVFAIGIVEWEENRFSSFPKEDRRDDRMIEAFRKRGVPESQITYLKDSQATTQNIHTEFTKFIMKPKADDTVFVYFTGHGFLTPDHKSTMLATYDTSEQVEGLTAGALPKVIEERFQGSQAIIAFDCCNSGAIVEHIEASEGKSRISYAAFASSHMNSGSTGNWTFTENLVYALNGDSFMDDDHNSQITFSELAANILQDMTFAENQMPSFAFTRRFNREVVIAKSSPAVSALVGERREFQDSRGDWYRGFIVDADGGQFKVRYYGWDPKWDEWVTADRMRNVPRSETFRRGRTVEAKSFDGNWYKGRVVAEREGLHYIKFDGWSKEWNEWLPADRLR